MLGRAALLRRRGGDTRDREDKQRGGQTKILSHHQPRILLSPHLRRRIERRMTVRYGGPAVALAEAGQAEVRAPAAPFD
jgi:hypothetical protein